MKSRYIEYGGKLALICLCCMLGVGGAYVMAMERIAEGKAAAVFGAITAVLVADEGEPPISMTDLTEKDGIYLYTTPEGEKRYATQGEHQGFSGKVVVAVGAREVGGRLTIIKMRVISQTETPGLGTRIALQSSNLTLWTRIGSALGADVTEKKEYKFLDQYEGKAVDNMLLSGDAGESETKIVKITGVTISSNAATEAAKKGLITIRGVPALTDERPEEELPGAGAEAGKVIEAFLLAAGAPLSVDRLKNLTGIEDGREIRAIVEGLKIEYQETGRAFTVEEVGGGFRLLTLPEYAPWLDRLKRREAKAQLTPAVLETLAIVAYRQPVLRADVEKIRGVDVGGALRGLVERGLVKVVGRAEEPGSPMLYGTTRRFLTVFGLKSLTDLPKAKDLRRS